MGSKTKNLGLRLTADGRPDSNTLFSVWRGYINGEGVGSNMELIDDAYGVMRSDFEAADKQLSDHIAYAFQQLKDLTDQLAQTRAALERGLSESVNNEDRVVIFCGNASNLIE